MRILNHFKMAANKRKTAEDKPAVLYQIPFIFEKYLDINTIIFNLKCCINKMKS